jgi:tRNA pseudouridine38-40 synthase
MPSFKLTLAYDGTNYVGWQRQASGTSVQGLLEEALEALEGHPVAVHGAGRTDAGVHALGQVASLKLEREIDPGILVRAVNARLPPDVRVLSAAAVPEAFHARYSAIRKRYRYRFSDAAVLTPFERAYVWHLSGGLDVEAMHDASRLFEGRHDFAALASAGSTTRSSERTMMSAGVRRESDVLVVFEITGDGFLRHMVRAMAGTLVDIGQGRRSRDSIRPLLASGDRAQAGPTAPARGLFLVEVEYADL